MRSRNLQQREEDRAVRCCVVRGRTGTGSRGAGLSTSVSRRRRRAAAPDTETTALGAAYLAGLAVEFFPSLDAVEQFWRAERVFEPRMDASRREELYAGWKQAVARCRLEPVGQPVSAGVNPTPETRS